MSDPSADETVRDREVLFEETLAMRDEEGAGNLTGITWLLLGVMIVASFGSMILVAGLSVLNFASVVGGIDEVVRLVDGIRSERPLLFGGFLLAGALIVGYGAVSILGVVRAMQRAFDERVHVTVTETGVTVEREGGNWYWRPSTVDVPFDAITAVEYLDPDESSTGIRLGDWRSTQFFAGRSRSWIRLERRTDPPVYLGSDRPLELADLIARRASGVETATPY